MAVPENYLPRAKDITPEMALLALEANWELRQKVKRQTAEIDKLTKALQRHNGERIIGNPRRRVRRETL